MLRNSGRLSLEQCDAMKAVRETEKDPCSGVPSVVLEQITGKKVPHPVAAEVLQMLIKPDLAALYQRVYDRIFVKGDDMDISSGSRAAASGTEEQEFKTPAFVATEKVYQQVQMQSLDLDEQHKKIVADLPEPEDEDMEEITTTGGRGEPVELVGL